MDSIPVSFFEKLKIILDNYSSFQDIIPSPRWMKGFDFIPTYKDNKNGKDEKKKFRALINCKELFSLQYVSISAKEFPTNSR